MRLEVVHINVFTLVSLIRVSLNGFDTSVLAGQNALLGTLAIESIPLPALVVASSALLCPCSLD